LSLFGLIPILSLHGCKGNVGLVIWNILRSFFSGVCCCFGGFVEHLPEISRRLRDDLLERCDLARESNSERRACSKLKARGAFNASEVCLRLD